VSAYEDAIRYDPRLRIAYINLGFAFAAQDEIEQSRRAFAQVLTKAEVLNNLALAKELRGDPKGARALYKRALITDPKHQAASQNLEAMGVEKHVTQETP
jgi:Flp pilus assembly protein TadD